jgi:hypothetical protein
MVKKTILPPKMKLSSIKRINANHTTSKRKPTYIDLESSLSIFQCQIGEKNAKLIEHSKNWNENRDLEHVADWVLSKYISAFDKICKKIP